MALLIKHISKAWLSSFRIVSRFVGAICITGFLSGCWVGITTVNVPNVPELQGPMLTDRDVHFDVCVPASGSADPEKARLLKAEWSIIVQNVLQRDFGIQARQEAPALDKQFFYFLVTPQIYNVNKSISTMHVASLIIAGLSLSVIPGYVSEESIIDIQFASRTHDGAMVEDQYRYTYGTSSYIWLPFVVYPDFFVGINGGYVAPGKKVPVDVTHLVIQRFMLDATEIIKKHTSGAKIIWPQHLIKCPE